MTFRLPLLQWQQSIRLPRALEHLAGNLCMVRILLDRKQGYPQTIGVDLCQLYTPKFIPSCRWFTQPQLRIPSSTKDSNTSDDCVGIWIGVHACQPDLIASQVSRIYNQRSQPVALGGLESPRVEVTHSMCQAAKKKMTCSCWVREDSQTPSGGSPSGVFQIWGWLFWE